MNSVAGCGDTKKTVRSAFRIFHGLLSEYLRVGPSIQRHRLVGADSDAHPAGYAPVGIDLRLAPLERHG